MNHFTVLTGEGPIQVVRRTPSFPILKTWMRLLCIIISLGAVLFVAMSAFAAGPMRTEHAEAEIVSEFEAIVPGQAFTLALRLKHDAGWHTVWRETSFELALPDGFSAGPVLWPAPESDNYKGSELYSCNGEIFLLVAITPPASVQPGTTAEFATTIGVWSWNGDAETATEVDLSLSLPVAAARGKATQWSEALRKARATAVTSSTELTGTGYRQGDKITLVVDAARDLNSQTDDFYFFEDDGLIDRGDQAIEWHSRRQVRIAVRGRDFDPKPTRLSGMLQAKRGWFPDGPECHAVEFALVDGPPPPIIPLASLASTVIRNLDESPDYQNLRGLYRRRLQEAGEKWANSDCGQRLVATLERLRGEAASVSTVDPEHPEKREVNYTRSNGHVLRFSQLIPSEVDKDEFYHDTIGAVICRFILEDVEHDGLLVLPPSPGAREGIDRGVAAAQRQDYLLAIRCFEEARAVAPRAPEVFFNLGVAESKRPGDELRAIAWFGAYLTADPYAPAPNEAAVLKQMKALWEKNRQNLSTWLLAVQDAAQRCGAGYPEAEYQWSALYRTVILWADAGEIAAAQKAAALIKVSDPDYCFSLHVILKAQLKVGDISGAQTTAKLIKERYDRSIASQSEGSSYAGEKTEVAYTLAEAQVDIAEAHIRVGEVAAGKQSLVAAQRSAGVIRYATYESIVQPRIAEGLLHANEIDEAKAILVTTRKLVDTNPESNAKVSALMRIARVQLLAGDPKGAAETFAFAASVAGPAGADDFGRQKAEAQVLGGDISGAQATIGGLTKKSDQDSARLLVVQAHVERGDNYAARATLALIENAYEQSRARLAIIQAAEQRGSVRADWLNVLAETDRIQDCPLSDPIFTDLAGQLRSLEKSDFPTRLFEPVQTISQTQVRARNAIGQMLNELTAAAQRH